MSDVEDTLLFQMRALGLPEPVREYRFAPPRRWRADFCYPAQKLIIEVDGGTWMRGRHVTGAGYEGDCDKLNTATMLGFRVLRFTSAHVRDGRAVALIAQALGEA